jgi:hypothetical protein
VRSASPSSAEALRAALLEGLARGPAGTVVLGAPDDTLALLRAVAHRSDADRVGLGALDAIALLTRSGATSAAAQLAALVRQIIRERRAEAPRREAERLLGTTSTGGAVRGRATGGTAGGTASGTTDGAAADHGAATDRVALRRVLAKVRA